MIEEFLAEIHKYFQGIVPHAYVISMIVFSVFLFWRSVRRVGSRMKNLSVDHEGRKIFDLILISVVFTHILARILYIAYMPEEFADTRWFWLPYEKIEGSIFWFESFPWKFFKLSAEGLLVDGLVLGQMFTIFFFAKVLKIKWEHIVNGFVDMTWWVFITILFMTAVQDESWKPFAAGCAVVMIGLIRLILNKFDIKQIPEFVYKFYGPFWKTAIILGLPISVLAWNYAGPTPEDRDFLLVIDFMAIITSFWILSTELLSSFLSKKRDSSGTASGVMSRRPGSPRRSRESISRPRHRSQDRKRKEPKAASRGRMAISWGRTVGGRVAQAGGGVLGRIRQGKQGQQDQGDNNSKNKKAGKDSQNS